MRSKHLPRLKALHREMTARKYPSLPGHAIPEPKYNLKDANGLTKCILDLIRFSGGAAFRVNSQGQYDAKLGRWRKAGSTPGIPDIFACIGGKFIGVEVKFGKDRQSDKQKAVEGQIKDADGLYLIVRDFDPFFEWMRENGFICLDDLQ